MSFIKKLSIRTLTLILVVSFVVPTALIVETKEAEAQAGAAASCTAGYVAAGVAALASVPQNIIGVPKSQAGDTTQGTLNNGSVNSLSFNNCILKPLGQAIVIALIRNIGASVVDWINSGFEGKPLFVTDFGGTLLNSADQAVGGLIEGSELNFLCSDFSFQIRLELALKYSRPFQDQIRCTLSDVADNVNNFVSNNGGAGWDNWLQLTTQPTNNVYGAYLIADSELAQRALNAVDQKEKRIAIGQGFLDYETCDRYETTDEINQRIATAQKDNIGNYTTGGTFTLTTTGTNSSGATTTTTQRNLTATTDSVTSAHCVQSSTKTPGRVIAGKLDSVLGQGEIQSAVAQEIDQVIAATLNQIAQKTLQGVGGLLGVSKKGSSSGPSYLDKYRAQYYGVSASTGDVTDTTDIGARSALDDYRVSNYQDAQALFNDAADPNTQDINNLVSQTVNSASNQQLQQQQAISENLNVSSSVTVNAALLKPASQSSGNNPGGAVDGVTQTNQYIKGSATDQSDANPWWEVNLGEDKDIKEVRIWKVSNKSGSESLGSFTVSAKNTAGETVWTSSVIDGGQSNNPIVVAVGQKVSAIRISKTVSGQSCFAVAYRGYDDGSICYQPLELAEVEVMQTIEAASTTGTSTAATTNSSTNSSGQSSSSNNDQTSPVSVESKAVSASTGGSVSSTASVSSAANRSIGSLDVSLENQTGQTIAFNQAFSQATIGLKQDGVTRNFQPGSSGTMTFTGVSTGPDHGTQVVFSGTLGSAPTGTSYTIRITAKDASSTALSVGTIAISVK